jgi:DMSO/TMAO reductase YedYZ molybdopterin-dependent catalytic subunit
LFTPNDGQVMLAYVMNGEDVPFPNGFTLRLIVLGYYGTYWDKHLHEITVIDSVYDGSRHRQCWQDATRRAALESGRLLTQRRQTVRATVA